MVRGPVVTGITPLGMDHVAQLGLTIENVAWHKAGIFKSGVPAFTAPQGPGASESLRNRASEKGTSLTFVSTNDSLPVNTALSVPFQRLNCSLALELARTFVKLKAPGKTISSDDISNAVDNFRYIGRFQVIEDETAKWFLDGAHNTLSLGQAAEWFSKNIHTPDIRA